MLDEKLDVLQALELDYVLRTEPDYRAYSGSCPFFERTLVTDNMLGVSESVVDVLESSVATLLLP